MFRGSSPELASIGSVTCRSAWLTTQVDCGRYLVNMRAALEALRPFLKLKAHDPNASASALSQWRARNTRTHTGRPGRGE